MLAYSSHITLESIPIKQLQRPGSHETFRLTLLATAECLNDDAKGSRANIISTARRNDTWGVCSVWYLTSTYPLMSSEEEMFIHPTTKQLRTTNNFHRNISTSFPSATRKTKAFCWSIKVSQLKLWISLLSTPIRVYSAERGADVGSAFVWQSIEQIWELSQLTHCFCVSCFFHCFPFNEEDESFHNL